MFWYHSTTKHSYNSVRTNPNRLSWEDQPSTYKVYPGHFQKQKLDLDKSEDNFLYHIAGLTAKKVIQAESIIYVSILQLEHSILMNSIFRHGV